jgi:ATP-dependent Lon protease
MMEYPFDGRFPVLPVRNTVIFPGQTLPLRVGRSKSVASIQKSKQTSYWVLAVAQRSDEHERDPSVSDLYPVGTLCKVEKIRGSAEEGYQVLLRGAARFRVSEYFDLGTSIEAQAEAWRDAFDVDSDTAGALLESLKVLALDILQLLPAETEQLKVLVKGIDDLVYLSQLCAGNLEIPHAKKQELLEIVSVKTRVLSLLDLMQTQKESLQVQSEIRDKLSHRMGKVQRENFLREQLRTIREELGEGEESGSSRENLRKKIDDAKMPEEVKKVALDELRRLESIGTMSPESHVIRNYLDLLCALPWSKSSAEGESVDLEKAREVLNQEHYGLNKIKNRILQHLAVMKLKKGAKGSILLFVGPPGVGKTSLGQSIAESLGRKFVRVSLGGVRDDAEIRGHRKTYVGAMPGRIVQGIKRAGENNPVFMLDEIDKLSRSFQGDPASALLEVLDPEQNANFLDHFLDVPFDLSHVFFIATANTLESIPEPLLDRMEVIDLTGYTIAEKLHIAKNHLLPKQLKEHGLSSEQVTLSDPAILRMISNYTREAGVRNLQRKLAEVLRSVSEAVLSPQVSLPIRIEVEGLEEILGPEKYLHEVAERVAPAGVVTGLAWTPQGGEILFVEASLMPGGGKLILTGQLGEVMKESAQIALSLVRSNLPWLVPGFEYDKKDIHIHVPAGAIPKDGPSAGIALVTTLASLFSGRSVDPQIAFSGEVTLRGVVMPVGGIKEKVIAAHRAGIRKVVLSKRNQKDLRDVPDEVKNQMEFVWVETVAEVLKVGLGHEFKGALSELTPSSAPAPAMA